MKTSNQQSFLRNNKAIWMTVAAIVAGYGSSAVAAGSMFESPIAPSAGIFQSQLVGGSTSSSPGSSAQDYLNAVNPSQTFSVSSAQSLASVTVLGNGDDGYWTGSTFSSVAGGLAPWHFQPTLVDATYGLQNFLKWDIQIGSVSGGVITPLGGGTQVLSPGWAPNSSSDYISFNLANSIALSPGTTYAFSLTLDPSTFAKFPGGGVWYGLQESLVPEAGGTAFDNGSTAGTFANNGVTSLGYSYVYELSNVPIPEPATLALLGFGALGAVMGLRRRRA
ncbi:MAG: PEP-CTERM sorting domain-containing protein [Verrucomicrobiia bacterium]